MCSRHVQEREAQKEWYAPHPHFRFLRTGARGDVADQKILREGKRTRMEDAPFYTYAIFVLVACVASVHLFHKCGRANALCKVLYALGLAVLLYVIFDTALACAAVPRKNWRQRIRQLVIQLALLALVLALFSHKALWRRLPGRGASR
jgi:hypothetical protein